MHIYRYEEKTKQFRKCVDISSTLPFWQEWVNIWYECFCVFVCVCIVVYICIYVLCFELMSLTAQGNKELELEHRLATYFFNEMLKNYIHSVDISI